MLFFISCNSIATRKLNHEHAYIKPFPIISQSKHRHKETDKKDAVWKLFLKS